MLDDEGFGKMGFKFDCSKEKTTFHLKTPEGDYIDTSACFLDDITNPPNPQITILPRIDRGSFTSEDPSEATWDLRGRLRLIWGLALNRLRLASDTRCCNPALAITVR